jgi:hypothetical protein
MTMGEAALCAIDGVHTRWEVSVVQRSNFSMKVRSWTLFLAFGCSEIIFDSLHHPQ